jgi:hypothetical protein
MVARDPFLLIRFVIAAAAAVLVPASAQSFPDRPVHIVVPYVPGVGADIVARLLAEPLKNRWNFPVIVDNRPGASGAIGAAAVVHSAPDGHTLLITGESLYSVYMHEKPAYDPLNDLVPVAQAVGLPFALVARKNFPAETWADLVAYARSHPNKVTIGTPGYGTPHHILTDRLIKDVGLDLYQIPGSAAVLQDVIGGRIDITFQPASVVGSMIGPGLKVFAAGGTERTQSLPATPSFEELGVQALVNSDSVNGFFVAKNTPSAAMRDLADGIHFALQDHEVIAKLIKAGFTVSFRDSASYRERVHATSIEWARILATVREKAQ